MFINKSIADDNMPTKITRLFTAPLFYQPMDFMNNMNNRGLHHAKYHYRYKTWFNTRVRPVPNVEPFMKQT